MWHFDKCHPRLPRGEAFRFTSFFDECSVTEWVTPGLPRMDKCRLRRAYAAHFQA